MPAVFRTLIVCRYPEDTSLILFAGPLFALVFNPALIIKAKLSYPHEGHFLYATVGHNSSLLFLFVCLSVCF